VTAAVVPAAGTNYLDLRVLVLAPTARDRSVTVSLLNDAGFSSYPCTTLEALREEIKRGAGAVVLTEEFMNPDGIERLQTTLAAQPAWSELPLIMLMRGSGSTASRRMLAALQNVVLLERPTSIREVLSTVQAAVGARRRQYQIRDQLIEIQRNIDELARAADQRRQLLDSERDARAQVERASRMKDEFLAMLSHELRTPMTSVLGWTQLLRAKLPDVDGESLAIGLEVIERNARLQAKLIDDMLDLSRIISGKVRLDLARIDPSMLVRAAVESVRHLAHEKDIKIEVADDRIPPCVGDAGRLQQVLGNLLSNAIKFTPDGGRVLVACRHVDGHAVISVRDSGIGIAKEFLPHVFDRFRQSAPTTTRRTGGLGLGLAIVKQLVELHRGEVMARSDGLGTGSLFVVKLPLADVNGSTQVELGTYDVDYGAEHRDVAGLHVLVVDDDADVREFLQRMLAENGVQVTLADSAPAALGLLERTRPDVIVSDIGMPDMDGYEFMRRVRAEPGKVRRLPAAALTAFAGEHDHERALAAGYQAHLPKPIDASELFRVLWQLGRTGGPQLTDGS
jgi:signal transduction histidine kinase/ActR/RegA family two-component response regulator